MKALFRLMIHLGALLVSGAVVGIAAATLLGIDVLNLPLSRLEGVTRAAVLGAGLIGVMVFVGYVMLAFYGLFGRRPAEKTSPSLPAAPYYPPQYPAAYTSPSTPYPPPAPQPEYTLPNAPVQHFSPTEVTMPMGMAEKLNVDDGPLPLIISYENMLPPSTHAERTAVHRLPEPPPDSAPPPDSGAEVGNNDITTTLPPQR